MQISGTEITTFNAWVKRDFKPKTVLSLKWKELSNGNWVSVDRGTSADYYETEVMFYGKESVIDNIISELNDNRDADENLILLDNFNNVDDRIFGANIDYTAGQNCAVIDYGKRAQNTWKGWGLTLRLRAISPLFLSPALSLPTLKPLIGYTGISDWNITQQDTYDGSISFLDRRSDSGMFSAMFEFNTADMSQLRNYLTDATNGRGNTISISALSGVDSPFGRRSSSYPYNVKVTKWIDQGMINLNRWRIKLEMHEVI